MNISHIIFELSAARMHLDALINELHDGRMEPDNVAGFQVTLEHILDHLCYAWGSRDFNLEQILNLPQEEFERLANTVPDMQGQRAIESF